MEQRSTLKVCVNIKRLIILVAWDIWKHRNNCVFLFFFNTQEIYVSFHYSVMIVTNPSVMIVIQTVDNECALWCMAGASKLSEFLNSSLAPLG